MKIKINPFQVLFSYTLAQHRSILIYVSQRPRNTISNFSQKLPKN